MWRLVKKRVLPYACCRGIFFPLNDVSLLSCWGCPSNTTWLSTSQSFISIRQRVPEWGVWQMKPNRTLDLGFFLLFSLVSRQHTTSQRLALPCMGFSGPVVDRSSGEGCPGGSGREIYLILGFSVENVLAYKNKLLFLRQILSVIK